MFTYIAKCLQIMQMLICIAKVYKINYSNNLSENYLYFLRYIINMYKNTIFNTNIQRFA